MTTRTPLVALCSVLVITSLHAQVDWTDATPALRPQARYGCAMAYDSLRQHVVMFGGVDATATYLADTWEWDGSAWTRFTPGTAPTARRYSKMAFDTARGVSVLFGGEQSNGTRMNDTWEWDGAAWTQRTLATKPLGRNGHGFAYDEARARIVLYGGTPNGCSETWEYDGTNWVDRTTSPNPGCIQNSTMAYDGNRRHVVLFGGLSVGPVYHDDMWEWNGSTWAVVTSAHRPSGRHDSGLAFDPLRARLVMFGGYNATSGWLGDTWEFFDGDWTQRTVAHPPGPRAQGGMVWDAARGVVMASFGAAAAGVLVDDVKLYGPTDRAAWTVTGAGCAGAAGTPTLSTADLGPFLGDVFTVAISNVPSPENGATVGLLGFLDTNFGSLTLPAELSDWGMPGCTLYNDIGGVFVLPVSGNLATWNLTIPTESVLLGLDFYQQALCFDAGANVLGLILSDQGRGRIGGL
ncbi:MAG: kelch repeat-containing protein [Planctomycetota bacterium]